MSSKLISEIGSRGRNSGSLVRADGSECTSGENLSKRPAVERNSEKILRCWICRRTRRNSENKFQFFLSGGLSVRVSASSKARMTRGRRGPLRIRKTVFIYKATEIFARLLQAFTLGFFFVYLDLLVPFHKLEKTVILTRTEKDGKFASLAALVTSV
jgi:hypothetical protein